MTKPILECNGIAAGYVKGLNILQGVDVVVNEGEIVSIIGPNGAGKSTLLKAIMSFDKSIRREILCKWRRKNKPIYS